MASDLESGTGLITNIKPFVSLPLGPLHRVAVKMNWIDREMLFIHYRERYMQRKYKKENKNTLTLNIQRMDQKTNLTEYTNQNYKTLHVFQATSEFPKKVLVHKWLHFNKVASRLKFPLSVFHWHEKRFRKTLCSLFTSKNMSKI